MVCIVSTVRHTGKIVGRHYTRILAITAQFRPIGDPAISRYRTKRQYRRRATRAQNPRL
jgi:hypothetical protein